jgi:hypothetical protein
MQPTFQRGLSSFMESYAAGVDLEFRLSIVSYRYRHDSGRPFA